MATVLVVDDDKVSRSVLKRILQNLGHESILADAVDSGWTALLDMVEVDMVILDNLLKNEYGWELLTRIRKDLVYKDLPVLVYSASSDRSSVIKYLQMGVLNIQTKPFKPQKIKEEIDRALQINWRNRFFEPTERVCNRLSINEDEYYRLLNSSADEIRAEAAKMKQLIGTSRERDFLKSIQSLRTFAANLGISILDTATEYLADFFMDQKIADAVKVISHLETMAKLMQHRFSTHFGIATEEDTKSEKDYMKRVEELSEDAKKEQAIKARQAGKTSLNRMLSAPLASFAIDLVPHLEQGVFTAKQTFANCTDRSQSGIDQIMILCEWALNKENQELIPLEAAFQKEERLGSSLLEIANFRNKDKKAELDLPKAIAKLGINRCMAIYACYRLNQLGKQIGSPINLLELARHCLGSALLTHELTLRIKNPLPFALYGALYQMGTWMMAIAHPGYYGIALSLAQGNRERLRNLEKKIFGFNKNDLGAHFLNAVSADRAFIDCALYYNQLDKLPESAHKLGPVFVHLANVLTRIFNIGFPGTIEDSGAMAFIESPAWKMISDANIKMPLKPDELFKALAPVIERVNWQVTVLLPG